MLIRRFRTLKKDTNVLRRYENALQCEGLLKDTISRAIGERGVKVEASSSSDEKSFRLSW